MLELLEAFWVGVWVVVIAGLAAIGLYSLLSHVRFWWWQRRQR